MKWELGASATTNRQSNAKQDWKHKQIEYFKILLLLWFDEKKIPEFFNLKHSIFFCR